jgi:hypothetical protein
VTPVALFGLLLVPVVVVAIMAIIQMLARQPDDPAERALDDLRSRFLRGELSGAYRQASPGALPPRVRRDWLYGPPSVPPPAPSELPS